MFTSQGLFFVLVKKPNDLKYLYDNVLLISEHIYKRYDEDSKELSYGYFPYFKLVKSHGNYRYHFLAVKRDYEYEQPFSLILFSSN